MSSVFGSPLGRRDGGVPRGRTVRAPPVALLVWSLFSVLPTALLVGLVETFARLGWPDEAKTHRDMMVEPDDTLLWRLIPQASGPFATNELGFRDDPPKADAGLRVLVIGDSVTWGHGVQSRAALYPILLERLLNEARPGWRIDVTSAAVPGYSTFQEIALVEQYAPRLDPDALVLQFCLNDVVERYRRLRQFGGQDVFLGIDTRRGIPGIYGFMLRSSRAFELVASQVARRNHDATAYEVRDLTSEPLAPHLEAAWQLSWKELDQLVDWSARTSVPLLLLVTPYRFQLGDPGGLGAPQRRLREYARARGIPIVDVLPDLAREEKEGEDSTFLDKSHFSAAGHAVVAQRLVTPVLSLLETPDPQAGVGATRP